MKTNDLLKLIDGAKSIARTIVHMQDGTEDVFQIWGELPDYHVLPTEGGAK